MVSTVTYRPLPQAHDLCSPFLPLMM